VIIYDPRCSAARNDSMLDEQTMSDCGRGPEKKEKISWMFLVLLSDGRK